MTPAQAFKELESAALAYANGSPVERVQRIHEAIAVLRQTVRKKRAPLHSAGQMLASCPTIEADPALVLPLLENVRQQVTSPRVAPPQTFEEKR